MTQQIAQTSEWQSRRAVALTLFVLPLVYFFPAVLGKVTFSPGDGWTQIIGIRILIVEFVFCAHSFRNGAAWSLAGVPFLLVGAIAARGKQKWLRRDHHRKA
jgi:hypothetical protein